MGVDLLPTPSGGWTIVELNGAVEFTREYAEWFDVFSEVALLLESEIVDRRSEVHAQVR